MKLKLTIASLLFAIIVHAQTKITISKVAELYLPSNGVKVDNSAIAKIISENLNSTIPADGPLFNLQYKVNGVSLNFSPLKGATESELNSRLKIIKNSQRGISKREIKDTKVNGNLIRYYTGYSSENIELYLYCSNSEKSKAFTSSIIFKKSDEKFARDMVTEIMKTVKFI